MLSKHGVFVGFVPPRTRRGMNGPLRDLVSLSCCADEGPKSACSGALVRTSSRGLVSGTCFVFFP